MTKIAILALLLGGLAVQGTETNYRYRECVANGNSPEQCALTNYGR